MASTGVGLYETAKMVMSRGEEDRTAGGDTLLTGGEDGKGKDTILGSSSLAILTVDTREIRDDGSRSQDIASGKGTACETAAGAATDGGPKAVPSPSGKGGNEVDGPRSYEREKAYSESMGSGGNWKDHGTNPAPLKRPKTSDNHDSGQSSIAAAAAAAVTAASDPIPAERGTQAYTLPEKDNQHKLPEPRHRSRQGKAGSWTTTGDAYKQTPLAGATADHTSVPTIPTTTTTTTTAATAATSPITAPPSPVKLPLSRTALPPSAVLGRVARLPRAWKPPTPNAASASTRVSSGTHSGRMSHLRTSNVGMTGASAGATYVPPPSHRAAASMEGQQPIKRRRGRPRKHPIVGGVSGGGAVSGGSVAAGVPVKRGFSCRVTSVDGREVEGDAVLVTLPLGVLKAG